MEIKIELLKPTDIIPYDLLLLADPSKKLVDQYLKRGECYLAIMDSKVIGVYVLTHTRPETIEIVNVALDESLHGKGIGKRLVLDAIDKARKAGAKTVEIGTGNTGINELFLYQKCGFRITGVDRDFFIRHYEEEIFENGLQCRDMVRLSMDL